MTRKKRAKPAEFKRDPTPRPSTPNAPATPRRAVACDRYAPRKYDDEKVMCSQGG
jgi:hypothetical protein